MSTGITIVVNQVPAGTAPPASRTTIVGAPDVEAGDVGKYLKVVSADPVELDWADAGAGSANPEDCYYLNGVLNDEPSLATYTTTLNIIFIPTSTPGTYVFTLPNGTYAGQPKRVICYGLSVDTIARLSLTSNAALAFDFTAQWQSVDLEWNTTGNAWTLGALVGATVVPLE